MSTQNGYGINELLCIGIYDSVDGRSIRSATFSSDLGCVGEQLRQKHFSQTSELELAERKCIQDLEGERVF